MTGTTPTAWQQRIETLLHALADARRDAAAAQAREVALLAEAVDIAQAMAQDAGGPASVADIPLRSLAAQIGAAAQVSDRTVQKHMSDAVVLVERFPRRSRRGPPVTSPAGTSGFWWMPGSGSRTMQPGPCSKTQPWRWRGGRHRDD